MEEHKQILAIDFGTQSVRGLVFDLAGNLVAKSQVAVEYEHPRPEWTEAKVEVLWSAFCEASQAVLKLPEVNQEQLIGVSITTQRSTVINLDTSCQPLRSAIVWPDQRQSTHVPDMHWFWSGLFRLMGVRDTIRYFQREAEINWLATHEPELWENTNKFLFLSGYLSHQLTGNFVDSKGSQVGYVPFNYKKQKWASSWDWKWQALKIKKSMLPKLIRPGYPMGKISPEAAQATGIPAGLTLYAAGSDKACEVLGSGSLNTNTACLSYGTTATINVTSKSYREHVRFLPAYPAALPKGFNIEAQIYRGFWMVTWFKEQFAYKERQIAKEKGIKTETLFDDLVNQVPAGSLGLMLQPYWSPGVRRPGPEAKGAMIGFGDVHTKAHMYRAILEGLAYALREGKERIESQTGVPIQSLRMAGGGSQSDAAVQLTADIFNLPAIRPKTYETSGLGAAINVAVGAGAFSDYHEAVKAMVHIKDVFEPDPQNQRIYDALYKKVYRKMYHRLKPLYEEIKEITGYPGN